MVSGSRASHTRAARARSHVAALINSEQTNEYTAATGKLEGARATYNGKTNSRAEREGGPTLGTAETPRLEGVVSPQPQEIGRGGWCR